MTEKFTQIAKYNFWDGVFPDLGIIRSAYIDRITEFSGNRLIKVIAGQRRAGKSYILRQMISRLVENGINPHNVLYINKEFTDFDFLANYNDLNELLNEYKAGLQPSGKVFLFIDEIQDIEGWERFAASCSQSFVDDYEVFITGSNSQLLSGELASLLSGRYLQVNVQPFIYQEFLLAKELQPSRSTYLEYLQTGGMPELFHLPNDEIKRHYLSAVKDTVLLKDIIQRYNVKDARMLEDIFVFLVNNASNLISVTSIVNYFAAKKRKTNYETVSNYIQYMESTFLVHKVDRFNIRGKETLGGSCKYYLNDLSFKNYLYPGFEYGLGYKLENAIYLQLLFSGYNIHMGTLRNKEIDFVAKKAARTVYLQCAYTLKDTETIEREYSSLKAVPDNFEKYVVSVDEDLLESNEGIGNIQAWNLAAIL